MIFEIEKENFKSIYNILDDEIDNVEVKAVIEGNNPGWIFADSLKSPETAVIWSKGIQGFYFVGDHNNSKFNNYISDYIDNEIIPRAKKEKLDRFEFSGENKKWCHKLEEIFAERKLNKSKQLIYKLKYDQWKVHKKRRLNDKFSLKEINAELLNDKNIENLNYITSEILRWWDSCDKYLEKTFGYCIIFNNKIVSYCICNFVYDNIHTIGIETLKDYRRKGLSQAAAEAFIEKCTSEKLDPHWECMESNIASRNLAEKLKFKLERVYRLYSYPLDKVLN
ncbi:GNAT family N-acetyltransferase [Halanaerobium kushneri]|uniref:GNAT acetyltransferase n=1 Tax=Halanaerobium kushneri TaxID=56779 RepID=A0A1N6PKC1_9FIRM|nr:GNAT family N-acetyltransferase [Halanaerobium kushneri]SIQ04838.1 GNAT acetyltransferase [Halanaerobium kushneri]